MTGQSPAPLTPEAFVALTGVSRETIDRLAAIHQTLVQWQPRINLVAPSTLDDPWRRHFLDSVQIASLVPARATRLVDLGSGAGFPGLVLAALGRWDCHLVEADQRKAAFLREAARLSDSRVTIHARRLETMPPLDADVVTARALAPLPKLLSYVEPFMTPVSRAVLLKGRGVRRELTDVAENWRVRARLLGSAADPESAVLVFEGVPHARHA